MRHVGADRNNVNVSARVRSRWCSPTASAATRTCGASSRPRSRIDYRVVLFDHVGHGRSDLAAYDRARYGTPAGLRRGRAGNLRGTATSPSGVRRPLGERDDRRAGGQPGAGAASPADPDRPVPRYVNDGDYVGGFSAAGHRGAAGVLDSNYLGWSAPWPRHHGQPGPSRAGDGAGPTASAAPIRTSRAISPRDVPVRQPCRSAKPRHVPSLVLQCSDDAIAPLAVGEYVHRHLAGSCLVQMRARSLPKSERAGGDRLGDHGVPGSLSGRRDGGGAVRQRPVRVHHDPPDGTIVRVNDTLLQWTGYRREDLISGRASRICSPCPGGSTTRPTSPHSSACRASSRKSPLTSCSATGRRPPCWRIPSWSRRRRAGRHPSAPRWWTSPIAGVRARAAARPPPRRAAGRSRERLG